MTRRERDLLIFICDFILERGKSPTYAEMATGLGLKSRGNTHRLVQKLVLKGYVVAEPHSFRSVELIDAERAATWSPSDIVY